MFLNFMVFTIQSFFNTIDHEPFVNKSQKEKANIAFSIFDMFSFFFKMKNVQCSLIDKRDFQYKISLAIAKIFSIIQIHVFFKFDHFHFNSVISIEKSIINSGFYHLFCRSQLQRFFLDNFFFDDVYIYSSFSPYYFGYSFLKRLKI